MRPPVYRWGLRREAAVMSWWNLIRWKIARFIAPRGWL
jgi:hypothetical protein